MAVDKAEDLEKFMEGVEARNPGEPEFHQAVHEVAMNIIPYIADKPEYKDLRILERMTEPDRVVSFRVVWEDDKVGEAEEMLTRLATAVSQAAPSSRSSRANGSTKIRMPATVWGRSRSH